MLIATTNIFAKREAQYFSNSFSVFKQETITKIFIHLYIKIKFIGSAYTYLLNYINKYFYNYIQL